MAGETKTIGDLITVIRNEGDDQEYHSEMIADSIDRLTDVIQTFGRFMTVQAFVLDRFVKDSDNHIKELIEDMRRAREEDSVRGGRPEPGLSDEPGSKGGSITAPKEASSIFSKLFGGLGSLAGAIFGPAIKSLTSVFTTIASPMLGLGRLFIRGGPVGAVIFGLYEIFKDIGENPIFTDTMNSIRTIFNDRIIPTFNSVVESISSLIGPGTMVADWFNNFRIQIQDFVLETLGNLTNTVAGVLEGIDQLLKGEWTGGISTIAKSLFSGVMSLFDSALSNILEMFGVDFGEDSSLFGYIGASITNLYDAVLQGWDTITAFVTDTWNSFSTMFMGMFDSVIASVTGAIQTTIDAFVDGGILSGIMTGITEAFSLMVTKPLDLVKDLAAWVAEQFGFDKAAEWLQSFSLDEAFRSFADFLTGIPQMLIDYAQEMWIDIWSKFKKGLVNLGAWISSIPDRIYLNAIEYLNNTSGVGYLIDDEAVVTAQRAVEAREAGTAEKLKQIDVEADTQRRALAQSQAERVTQQAVEASAASRTTAAPVVAPLSVHNGGNITNAPTTYNTVVNPSTSLDTPSYLLGK